MMRPGIVALLMPAGAVLMLARVVAGGAASAADAVAPSDWADPRWPSRLVIDVRGEIPAAASKPEPFAAPESVYVRLPRSEFPDGPDRCRVVARGRKQPLPLHVREIRETGEVELAFPLRAKHRRYDVYLGVPSDSPASPPYTPPYRGLLLTTYRYSSSLPERLNQMDDLLAQSRSHRFGSGPRARIDDTSNPFGPDDNYLALYQAWLYCPQDGRYTLALDCDDAGFVFLDGRSLVSWGGRHNFSSRPWNKHSERQLAAGFHHLLVYHAEGSGPQGIRVGWRRPGMKRTRVIPERFLRGRIIGDVTAREDRTAGARAYFTAVERIRFRVRSRVAEQPFDVAWFDLKASEINSADAKAKVQYRWQIPDETRAAGREKGREARVFVRVGTSAQVSLTVSRKDNSWNDKVTRTIIAAPRRDDEAWVIDVYLDERSAPDLIFADEGARLFVSAVNESIEDLPFALTWREAGSTAEARTEMFTLKGVPSEKRRDSRDWLRVFEYRVKQEALGRSELPTVRCTLGFPGVPVFSRVYRFLPARGEWPALNARDGPLKTVAGDRAIVVIQREDDRAYRRLAPLRQARAALQGRGDATLLYGDAMQNSDDPRGETSGLVAPLKAVYSIGFRHAPFAPAIYPILGAVAGIDRALAAAGRGKLGRVILCPGMLDIRSATPSRLFARGLDALIDRVRRFDPAVEIVLVGPLPEVEALAPSRRWQQAARDVARRHRITFIDLHEALEARTPDGGWQSFFREPGYSDQVYHVYPLGPGRDRIVQAIAEGTNK